MPPLPPDYLLSPEDLRTAGLQLFGEKTGWQSRMAEAIGVDRSAITRWLNGPVPVPLYASLLIRYMLLHGLPQEALISKTGKPKPHF